MWRMPPSAVERRARYKQGMCIEHCHKGMPMNSHDITLKRERLNDAVFAATNLEHKRFLIEPELVQLKWYGYRFLTPLAATKLFYDTYNAHLINYLRVNKDKDVADSVTTVAFDDFAKNLKNLANAWTARQRADEYGVPYNLYIEFCMSFWSARSWGGRRYAPQINQLSYTERSEVAWHIKFEKFFEDRLDSEARSLAGVPQLHPAAFCGTPEQVATRDFLLALIKRSERSWSDMIEKWCYTYPVLTPKCFETIVDAEVLDAAIEKIDAADREPAIRPDSLLPGALWPSCHGMPGAKVSTAPGCITCEFANSCGKLASLVISEVQKNTGHKQPRKVQLRAPRNARQARYRARQKLRVAAEASGRPTETSVHAPTPEAATI